MSLYWKIILAFLLVISINACTLPANPIVEVIPTSTIQPTPSIPPTPTVTPFPTPIPTQIPAARVLSGDKAVFYGDWDLAIAEYTAALDNNPDPDIHSAALLGVGRTRYKMGDYPESLAALREIVEEYPASPHLAAAHFALAQTYTALYRYKEAVDAYAEYLSLRPGVIDSYVQEWRGDASVANGDYLAAIDIYQTTLSPPRLGEVFPIQVKIAQAYSVLGDHPSALIIYSDIYTNTTNDYIKAQVDFLMGQEYTALGQTEQAYAAYLDAVENYPRSYDTYQGLIILVNEGYPVNEFDRGMVDYFAGQYNLAIMAFDRHLSNSLDHVGEAYFYKGMAYRILDNPEAAVREWDTLIQNFPEDVQWDDAWEEKAYTQWAYLDQYAEASQTLLDFVENYSWHERAAEFLFDAARITERAGDLEAAANLWERVAAEYPTSDLKSRAIFLAGISYYRAANFQAALGAFERFIGSTSTESDQTAGLLWIGKTHQARGDAEAAQLSWGQAVNIDPTGYYSERARDILLDRSPFSPPQMYDLGFDLQVEKAEAEAWMVTNLNILVETDLSSPGPLLNDPRTIRGTELWSLGLFDEARLEFEALRLEIVDDPVNTYRLANYLLDLGLYRSAIYAARQVLTSAGLDDAATMNAPIYFNHLRFGTYYRDLILPVAEALDINPLFLFSVIRQESLFEGFVRSSAGARGLMQIMPSTGQGIVANTGWPADYTDSDLYRPKVSVTLGADYLGSQRDYFDGDLYAALAAYNAGPGNAAIWHDLAEGDQDLFLEIVRFDETRRYIKVIYEVYSIYRRLYDRSP